MQMVSLFSGIGGFEIAGELMGWDIVSSCEINPFCQKILKYYWPNAYHHDNVKTLDYEKIKDKIDPSKPTIIVGGFPCQPFSIAGKRKGSDDERYGWPDCIKAVRLLRPNWCLFENVFGIVNWNGGMVFDEQRKIFSQAKSSERSKSGGAYPKSEQWENFPTQPPVRGRNDGLSEYLDGITFSKWRNESIKAYGNAIVPQVAYQVFKAIEQYGETDH